MSPELAFVLTLALRMAITAAFVIAASMITERSGPVIGALVATLPVSAGPSYIFLALDHDAAFVADAALAGIPMNAATILAGLAYVFLAQRNGTLISVTVVVGVWLASAIATRLVPATLLVGVVANLAALVIALPLVQRFRTVQMPLIPRRWYDIPLRAALVSTLVATVVTLSSTVGPKVSGTITLFPVVFTSLMLILQPRIGGPPTAALLANGLWGMAGFGMAVVVLHLGAKYLGSVAGLSLGLATCVTWNLGLWAWGRRKRAVT